MALAAAARVRSPVLALALSRAAPRAAAAVVAPHAGARDGSATEAAAAGLRRSASGRPLSPHLTIYKFGQNAITSIGFRATGIVMTGGIFVGSLGALLASHPAAHYVEAFRTVPGLLPLIKFGIAAPLTYHYIGGLRHLGWDNLIGHDMATANTTGLIMMGSTLVVGGALAFVQF
uniref:Succinate dehydrogenase cytochrome b560 subunit, mitochondrial n=1 Tax=Bicosoecida sp. CB-2014 TaxID=1486930 RepID=A0A7S1CLR6_9STRA